MEARDITRLGREAGQEVNVSESERWVSFVFGGMMALLGIQLRSVGGTLLALGGAALIHRGATGHCAAYEALEVSTAEHDREPPLPRRGDRGDRVEEASIESFPASDPPSWTPTTGPGAGRG